MPGVLMTVGRILYAHVCLDVCAERTILQTLRHLGLPRPSLKINRHITFCLALQAGIAHGSKPFLRLAIIFESAILNGFMEALADVMEHDSGFLVSGQRKPYTIGVTVSRHVTASTGITDIAELAKFNF
jgi:hypothetical protein